MKWLELHLDTQPAGIEPATELLSEYGIDSLMIDEEGDFKDFLENNHQYWDYVDDELMEQMHGKSRITFYLEDSAEGYNTLAQFRIGLSAFKKQHPEYAPLILSMENVEDADWENNWKQFYKPMEIGERLLVVPEWEQAEEDGRVKLVLNPGLTFGTGSHATTRLCLQALEQHIHGGEKVLDLGCGSGILSIAALLLGAKDAFACDIDDKCIGVAYENAALNGVGKKHYTVRAGDVLSDKRLQKEFGGDYDVIVANIVADVIIALAPQVGKLINMVVYDPAGKDAPKQPHVIINPEVTLTGREIVSEKEGCLSVPMDFRADVLRSETIHLKALDLDGNVIDRDIDGFEASIVQHETDHLKGVLFIDKIGRIRRAFYDNKVKKWLKRQKQAK